MTAVAICAAASRPITIRRLACSCFIDISFMAKALPDGLWNLHRSRKVSFAALIKRIQKAKELHIHD